MKEIFNNNNNWKVNSSELARNTFNPIRNILETMDMKPNPEKSMISLSIGDPTVFGNLKTHDIITKAMVEAVQSGKYNGYGPSTGILEAREAVAKFISTPEAAITAEDVILTSGCSSALDICISVLANPGQNILVPSPAFPLYSTLANGLGIETKEYKLIPERNWEADLDHMENLIDGNTMAILINNPSNPCGSVYSEKHLLNILELAEKYCLPIIADEIYSDLVFSGEKFVPMATLTQSVPILSCGGIGKKFLVPGWRLGWITIHDRNDIFAEEVVNGLKRLSQRILGPNVIVQGALPTILRDTPEEFFQETRNILEQNALTAFQALSKIPGLKPMMPQGAMYMMVGMEGWRMPDFKDDLEIISSLVKEQSVMCLPGKCFNCPDFFRIVLTVPEEILLEACQRMAEFFSKYVTVSQEPEFEVRSSQEGKMQSRRSFIRLVSQEEICSTQSCLTFANGLSRLV